MGKGTGFVRPRPGINDNFDIGNLEEFIKFLKADIQSAENWIAKYRKDKIKYKNNPRFSKQIDLMIQQEIFGRRASEEQLSYYKVELDEEIRKNES